MIEAGLTPEAVGFDADLRWTYISILEVGQQQPTLTTILKLAKPWKHTAHDIIGLVEAEIHRAGRRQR